MNLMWFEKFGFHGYSSDWRLDIVKQEMSDWPGNNEKMTLHRNFKLRFSERPLDLVIDCLFKLDAILEVWVPWVLTDWKMNIAKQGMSDWPGNGGKVTSCRNLKLRYSESSLDLVRGF